MHLKLLLLCGFAAAVQGYHILCVLSIPSRSHNLLGAGIVDTLLDAGHEVTWVTSFPPKKTKDRLTIIDSSELRPLAEGVDMTKITPKFQIVRDYSFNVSLRTSALPELKEVMLTKKVDAVITENFFSDMDGGYAAVLQVPWIVLSGSVLQPVVEAMVDEVRSVPVHPMMFNDFAMPMTFFERAWNVLLYNLMSFGKWMSKSLAEQHYHTMFDDIARARNIPLPPYDDVITNVSIMFVNTHPSLSRPKSLPPNVIDVGGFHIDDNVPPLPKDLQDLMDSSTNGVIYFSMGSIVRSSALPLSTKQALLKVFSELPYTVLWKFEEELTGLPKNVHIKTWMPQASILAHNKTKVFITHGGMLSNLETLKYGIPLVSIPFFGDQISNAARAARSGYAVKVTYSADTLADNLREALAEVLGSDKYTKRVKYLSALFNKRPAAPRKLIAHYVEEAIATQGAYHLRSSAKLYQWYQLWMLDLLAALLLTLYIVYRIAKVIIRTIVRKITGESKNKVKTNYIVVLFLLLGSNLENGTLSSVCQYPST